MRENNRRVMRGEEPLQGSKNEVKDMPPQFKKWVDENQDRIARAKTLPYFLRDNGKMTDEGYVLNMGTQPPQKPSILERAKLRHEARTPEQIKAIKQKWEDWKFDRLMKESDAVIELQELKTAKLNGYLSDDVNLDSINSDIKSGYLNRALSRIKIFATATKRHMLRTQKQIDSIQQAWNNRSGSVTLLKSYKTNAQVENTFKKINDKLTEKWFENGDLKLALVTASQRANGSTNMLGRIRLTANRLSYVKSALGKIGSGKSGNITKEEADAIVTFWHEITHNRHNNKLAGGYAGQIGSNTSRYMELANEYVARKTLPEFYEKLGVKKDAMPHPEFMNNRSSTGYNSMVNNYDLVVKTSKLNEGKVLGAVKKHLFTQDYIDQEAGLIKGLKAGGIKKLDGSALSNAEMADLLTTCKDRTSRNVIMWLVDHNVII